MNSDFFKWVGVLFLLGSVIMALGQLPRFRGRFYDGSVSLPRRLDPVLVFVAFGLVNLMGYMTPALALIIIILGAASYIFSRSKQ